ncbi:SAM-dependent methyltransferase [Phycicoccus flavus]|uniref:Methyltransferase domain-containing protein n=1 Tax=Phycicoccus flavus TaxID=2502783 RepID=A0A8T6R5U3_9MICO|nr:methyltransferase domain-containing protein [Phycicoccus flavus]NHA69122.1 methyltransferase domain-containing protein [Phycicoccus flavus]
MTSHPPPAGTGARLTLNSPLSSTSLDRLVAAATEGKPSRVIDHGCGWGEALLRALVAAPVATGVGIDLHAPDLVRARTAAEDRGLGQRVEFVLGSSVDHREAADLVISLGAFQAFGEPSSALCALREDARPGGRALFGLEYWVSSPTAEELGHMWDGASEADCLTLPDIVDLVHAAGWRVLDLHDSTRQEFDAFEVGHLQEREQWAVAHRGETDTIGSHTALTAELDQAWTRWLRGHRRSMGFVSLVLG